MLLQKDPNISSIFDWIKETVVENLYDTEDYNGNEYPRQEQRMYNNKFISNRYAMRLGPPRLRLLRVVPSMIFK